MQNQQARFVPFGRGMLRDQFRRQFKIKIGGSHRASFKLQLEVSSCCAMKSFGGDFGFPKL
jgi:hypothetical protein